MADRFNYSPRFSPHEDCKIIHNMLAEAIQRNEKVCILNFYKELPINSTLALSAFDDDRFEVSPNKLHLSVLQEKQRTIICLKNGQTILAECSTVCSDRGFAVLQDFKFVQLHCNRRKDFRVRFDRPINIMLHMEDRKIPGMLRDISLGGACITTFSRGLKPDMLLNFTLKTFDSSTNSIINIELPSRIIRSEGEKLPVLCCFSFEIESECESQLMTFINQRQMEIIKALRG